VRRSVLQSVPARCSAWQCVAVRCNSQCVGTNILRMYLSPAEDPLLRYSVMQCVAVCCSVFQRVRVRCSALQQCVGTKILRRFLSPVRDLPLQSLYVLMRLHYVTCQHTHLHTYTYSLFLSHTQYPYVFTRLQQSVHTHTHTHTHTHHPLSLSHFLSHTVPSCVHAPVIHDKLN